MKTYIVRYEEKGKGTATVRAEKLGLGAESRTAVLYDTGGQMKAIFPLEHISGIVEVDEKQAKEFSAIPA